MRFRLSTLMIVLALGPPLLWLGWGRYQAWKADRAVTSGVRAIDVSLDSDGYARDAKGQIIFRFDPSRLPDSK